MSTGNSPTSGAQTPRVSRWLGVEGEELTLARARAALALCARAAGRPGWIWLAGIFYPALDLVPGSLASFLHSFENGAAVSDVAAERLSWVCASIVLVFPIRLIVGLE